MDGPNVQELLDENARLREQVTALQQQLEDRDRRTAEIATQNATLASLYVASYQLHGTVERSTVLQVMLEIVANLIGSEEMAVYEVAHDSLELAASNGIDRQRLARIGIGEGTIGRSVASGGIYVAEGGRPDADGLTACIPLQIEGRPIGAIAIFGLLPQKPALADIDREMFELLAHASTSLYCATLHGSEGAEGCVR